MTMPSDTTPDITEAMEADAPIRRSAPRAAGPSGLGTRLAGQLTPQQGALAVAAFVTFLGVAYVGPALSRLLTPKTRAQRLKDEAAFRAEALRRRAQKTGARAGKRVRRLGGGTIRR